MPMREECRHYQSRTYPGGEVVRKCAIDLAPEAPWRCPDNCEGYELQLADAGFVRGSLVAPPVEEEPTGDGIAELLDEAEDIVHEAMPEVSSALEYWRRSQRLRFWRPRSSSRRLLAVPTFF